jgi:YbbR domain-containing protein
VQRAAQFRFPFTIDFGRVVLSVALAFVLYLFAINETNPETATVTGFTITPQLVNVPPNLIATQAPPAVHLRVRAPANVIASLQAGNFTAQIDAAGAVAGDNQLPVTVQSNDPQVQNPTADPSSVTVNLEEIQERTLPVRINLTGQVPSGYAVGQQTSDPAQVTVRGPASAVSQTVETVVDVNVNNVTVNINGVYTPRPVDDHNVEVQNLRLTPPSVNVSVQITQQTQYKELGIKPTIQGQPAPGYYLEPVKVNPPTTTVYGQPSALQNADAVITAPVDVDGLQSTVVRTVGLVPPSDTLLLDPTQTVQVTVQVAPLTITSTLRIQPSVINLQAGITVANQPSQVAVTISGPQPTLSGLGAGDFRVVLDVSGKGPGRYDVAPTVQNLPAGMTVVSFDPRADTVELAAIPIPIPPPPPSTPTPIVPSP